MPHTLDKLRRIVSPALAPAKTWTADAVLTIGLVNNMPDSALQPTERRFTQLLQAAAGDIRIQLHCFSLPSVKRTLQAKQLINERYVDIGDLDRLHVDALIVTGAEPAAATLPEEAFWQDLIGVINWATTNTRSTIWSCLAAHAAALHLDGIERQQLGVKCSGVYDCAKVSEGWLTQDITSPLKIAHSRLNSLGKSDLLAHGYQVLTETADAGIDIFAKRWARSHFVYFQGHPEYDALSLQREYLRDITRFLSRQQDTYPAIPVGYFTPDTERKLVHYQRLAWAERTIPLSEELPPLILRPDLATGLAVAALFKNWLNFLKKDVTPDGRTP